MISAYKINTHQIKIQIKRERKKKERKKERYRRGGGGLRLRGGGGRDSEITKVTKRSERVSRGRGGLSGVGVTRVGLRVEATSLIRALTLRCSPGPRLNNILYPVAIY